MKIKIAETHNACKDLVERNGVAQNELHQMVQASQDYIASIGYGSGTNLPQDSLLVVEQPHSQSVGRKFESGGSVQQPLKNTSYIQNSIAEKNTDYDTITKGALESKALTGGSMDVGLESAEKAYDNMVQHGISKDRAGQQSIPASDSLAHHTLLEEKYVQEAQAQAAYQPRYMRKLPKGFSKQGGPSDLKKNYNYNQKLSSFIGRAIQESGADSKAFAGKVEGYF